MSRGAFLLALSLSMALITASPSTPFNKTRRLSVRQAGSSAFIDAPASLFGAPRTFEAVPPPGVHPRVLLSGGEVGELVARFATRGGGNTFEEYFYGFTRGEHGPGNEALGMLLAVNISRMADAEMAAIVELGWGVKRNGRTARMEEKTAAAMFMSSVHALIDGEENVGAESAIVAKMVQVMDVWATCLQAHGRIYDCYGRPGVTCRSAPSGGYQGSLLWRKDWALAQEWGTGSFGLAMSYDLLWNHMGTGARAVVRENVRAALQMIVKGRYTWGMDLNARRIVSNWGEF
jgi:hypothetical protein